MAVVMVLAGCTDSGPAQPTPITSQATTGTGGAITSSGPIGSGAPVGPSAPASGSGPTSAPAAAAADNPALDGCDDLGVLPCARQVAFAQLPIAGTAITLAYSSDRASGRTQDKSPSADSVGLGGWTLSVLDSFDPVSKTVISGTGTIRRVSGMRINGQTAVADLDGSRVDLFDGQGRLYSILDSTTGTKLAAFTWDSRGLASVSDRSGVALTIVRSGDGSPTRLQVPGGAGTDLGVSVGRLAAVGYPDGSVAEVRSAGNGLLTELQDAAGAYTRYGYDEQGRLTSTTDGAGSVIGYHRQVSGSTLTVDTQYPNGSKGVDTVSVHGGATTWAHTEPSGSVSSVMADGMQRTISMPGGRKVGVRLAADPRWGTDAALPAVITDGDQQVTTTSVRTTPASGTAPTALSRTVTIAGKSWSYGYDPATRTATRTDPAGATVTTGYDAQGRAAFRDDGGLVTDYRYNDAGRIAQISLGTGPDARTWKYSYAPGVVTVTDPMGRTQRRTGTVLGGLQSISGPGSAGLTLHRDGADRLTGFAAPGGGSYRLTRRADGQPAALTAPSGQGGPQFTGYDYDNGGRLIKVLTGNTTLAIHRDKNGRIGSYDAGGGAQTASYDDQARLSGWTSKTVAVSDSYTGPFVTSEKSTGPVSGTISRTVDSSGRTLTETANGTSTVAYTYDGAGRLTKAGDLSITNDNRTGRTVSQSLGTLTATFTPNQFGETVGEKITGSGGAAVAEMVYRRDHLGRVTEFDSTAGLSSTRSSYSYDQAGRLVSESTDGVRISYTYDAAGNLTSVTDSGGKVTKLSYDARNALLTRGDNRYGYDSAGRLATTTSPAGTTTFHYDANGALLSLQQPGKPEIAYTVDGFGRRTATSVGGRTTAGLLYRDPLRPAAELDGSGAVTKRYVYKGTSPLPAYVSAAGVNYLEVADATGGPGLVIDSSTGKIADRVSRTAFGSITTELVPGWQTLGFAAGVTDPSTSLVRFGARDYDTTTGRWSAPDPLGVDGGSANLYEYVGNDPVNRSDARGTSCDYFSIGLSGGGGVGPAYGSFTTGFAYSNGQFGTFNNLSGGSGFGGGGSVVFNCMDKDDHSDPGLDDFSGKGSSADLGKGVSAGQDIGYNSSGGPSSHGGHLAVGAGTVLGGSLTTGWTSILCLYHCPPPTCVTTICNPDSSAPNPYSDPCISGCGGPIASEKSLRQRILGEPHLRTADGVLYDEQGAGEFTALATAKNDLTVQVRQQPIGNGRSVDWISAAAVAVNGDRLMFTNPDGTGIVVSLKGGQLPKTGSVTLPHGAKLAHVDDAIAITMSDGSIVRVQPNPLGLNVDADLADARRGQVHGLLGPFTGRPGSAVVGRDGAVYTPEQLKDYDTLYGKYLMSWRISATDSLFDYAPGQSTASFTDLTFPDRHPAAAPAGVASRAEQICRQLDLAAAVLPGCVMDVEFSGDAGFASIMATATDTVPGSARQSSDQFADPATGDITPGATVRGSISAGGSRSYSFSVPAGTVAYFAATADCRKPTSGSLGSYVADAAGAHLTGEPDICSDLGRVQFAEAGSYQLVISSIGGGTGPYGITWQASRPDLIRPLVADAATTGTIDKAGARDIYTLAVTAGTVGFFARASDCADATADALHWYILSPDGSRYTGELQICSDLGRVQFAEAGSYQLVISSVGRGTGPYGITWQASRPDLIRPLVAGAATTGTIDKAGARDIYTLAVTAGTVGFFAAATDCADATADALHWYILSPDGSPYTGELQICGDQGRVQFSQSGSYQLVVASNDGGIGGYTVTWRQSRPDLIRPLTVGSTTAGAIEKPGAQDLWTFSASANLKLRFTATAGCTDTGLYWAVQNSSGVAVSGRSGLCGDAGDVTLPTAGNYQLVISGDGPDTGSYSFSTTTR